MTTDPATHDSAPLTKDERSELTWLRAENKLLRVERDILIRVATGYANDMETLLQRKKPTTRPARPPTNARHEPRPNTETRS